jgi:hypothetical protein
MLFCGNEGLDGERKAMRHAMIVENLQQLYTDFYNDWILANEQAAEDLRWRAAAIDRYLKVRMRASHSNFVDAFAAFRDWEMQNPDEAANFVHELPENAVVEFAKSPGTANLVRDLQRNIPKPRLSSRHSGQSTNVPYHFLRHICVKSATKLNRFILFILALLLEAFILLRRELFLTRNRQRRGAEPRPTRSFAPNADCGGCVICKSNGNPLRKVCAHAIELSDVYLTAVSRSLHVRRAVRRRLDTRRSATSRRRR